MRSESFKDLPSQLDRDLGVLGYIAQAGYMVGLNVTVRGPEYFRSTYPESWQKEYEEKNYMFLDPMLYWSMTKTGSCRWSEVAIGKSSRVFRRAKEHGLNFGATLSVLEEGKRCLLSVGRGDRELTDQELEDSLEILRRLATVTLDNALSNEELETLRLVANGFAQKEIAAELGVAEATIKLRLSRVKDKLGARNTTHAVSIAVASKLLS